MENLISRLDALQDHQMDIYEKDSDNIEDSIDYWKSMRGEHTLLHCARKAGIKRVGIQCVPPAHVSETRAKEAISMQLLLESLADSVYGTLKWKLSDTSLEMYNSPPAGTFKHDGKVITVKYGGDASNLMEYCLWGWVYYQDEDQWCRQPSRVDRCGIYYVRDGNSVYYVDFASEATKYGGGGVWEVLQDNGADANSGVMSRDSRCGDGAVSLVDTAGPIPGGEAAEGQPAGPSELIPPSPKRPRTEPDRARHEVFRPRDPDTPTTSEGAGGGKRNNHQSPGGDSHGGRRRQQRWRNYPHVPAIIVRGAPNCVKCLRHRFKTQHSGLYVHCSTSWAWAAKHSTEGRENGPPLSHITVTFKSVCAREHFIKNISIPVSMTMYRVDMPKTLIPGKD
nr:E2 [Firstpapillomavirinae PV-HMU-1]